MRIAVTNRLLAALTRSGRQHLVASCEQVELAFGDVIYEPAKSIRHVYFPIDSFISLLNSNHGRAHLEMALVGNEGMLGVPLILGVNSSPLQALVQGGGDALRITVRCGSN